MWFKNEFPYFYHVNRFFEIFSTIPKKNAASSNYIGTAAPFSPTEFFEFVGPKFQKKTQGGGSSQGEFWAHSGINANQEDVHEFLMFLVDCLHEEALKFEDLEKIRQEGLGKANYFEKTEQGLCVLNENYLFYVFLTTKKKKMRMRKVGKRL